MRQPAQPGGPMKQESWRREAASYPQHGVLLPRYTDVDVWQHLNNTALISLHAEACQRWLRSVFGPEVWRDPSLVLAKRSSATDFLAEAHYPEPLDTGVRAINALLTVGRGQRLGLFARFVLGVSLVQLGLLRQRCACGAAFELLVQGDRLFVGARIAFVGGFAVEAVGAPAGGLVNGGGVAAGQGQCHAQRTQRHDR